jgi:very-short-patch-repair endonuclease
VQTLRHRLFHRSNAYQEGEGMRLAKADYDEYSRMWELSQELKKSWDTPRRWSIIREYYGIVTPRIKEGKRVSPYGICIADFLTPIEVGIWHDIRSYGLPFYPQYPVGRYFVDFGDPVRRNAIECDGKQWHDKKKDAERDRKLGDEGWTVFRFPGKDCWKQDVLNDLVDYYMAERRASINGEG